jgi:hypothetical protein
MHRIQQLEGALMRTPAPLVVLQPLKSKFLLACGVVSLGALRPQFSFEPLALTFATLFISTGDEAV